uniref:Uncharacterized protein n=1 Tax=Anguilla anguilla TaxID=7936 RepID=A0A0E9SD51_ANGAN
MGHCFCNFKTPGIRKIPSPRERQHLSPRLLIRVRGGGGLCCGTLTQ